MKEGRLWIENMAKTPVQMWLKIEDIKVPDIRLDSEFTAEEIEEFRTSMAKDGQLEPIIVVEDEDKGIYWLVDGRHRLEALKALGHNIIRAEVRRGKLLDAIVGSAICNVRRGRVSPSKLAKLVQYLHRNMGWSLEKIAETLGYKSKGYISNLLKVAENPELLKMAESGQLTLHDVQHLEGVPHAEPISKEKGAFGEISLKRGVHESEEKGEIEGLTATQEAKEAEQPLTDEDLGVTTNLKKALEEGKRFMPLGPEDLKPQPVKTKSAICDFCGRKVARSELKFLKLHADCYDEVVDILENVKAERESKANSPQP
ncbi:MAG: ParB/RepB/Spo0J family partition protein [Candidatus Bathyarchaeia archaeon]